jgi:hypothetical protein
VIFKAEVVRHEGRDAAQDRARSPLPVLRQAQKKRSQTMAHARERELINEIHHRAQPRSHHLHNLQPYLRVRKAELLKILLANVEQIGLGKSCCGGRKIAAVKNSNSAMEAPVLSMVRICSRPLGETRKILTLLDSMA